MLQAANDSYIAALFRRPPDGQWLRVDVEPFVPTAVALDAPVYAQVNHGRWIVACECGGAQLTRPGLDRFLCLECLNDHVGRQWRKVLWPRDVDAIDDALTTRPVNNRNWVHGETVAQLLAENEVAGNVEVVTEPGPHVIAPGTVVHPDSELAGAR